MTTGLELRCADDRRRQAVREQGDLNGIDYVEVETPPDGGPVLTVFLIASLPPATEPDWLRLDDLCVTGGSPVVPTGLKFLCAKDPERDDRIEITLDHAGDHAEYTLRIAATVAGLDPRYASARFRFGAGGVAELDCRVPQDCRHERGVGPDINYLAKDYSSFRPMMLDRLAVTLPDWHDHDGPDIYLTIVEVLAYVGDQLSYAQDATATEAYLETARLRTSVRRHARLVDYRLHEGCNARAWVCVEVDGDPEVRADALTFLTRPDTVRTGQTILEPADLDANRNGCEVYEVLPEHGWEEIVPRDIVGPRALATRLLEDSARPIVAVRAQLSADVRAVLEDPSTDAAQLVRTLTELLRALSDDPGFALAGGAASVVDALGSTNALHGAALRRRNRCYLQDTFGDDLVRPVHLRFHQAHNEIRFHTWVSAVCCLPRGATTGTLRDEWTNDDHCHRALEHLRVGEVLIFEEVAGPTTGNPADADLAHRHAVRLTAVQPSLDPVGGVPVVEITWHDDDALPFDLVLSTIGPAPECALLEHLSVARGNVVLVDHGETIREPDPVALVAGKRRVAAVAFPPPDDVTPPGSLDMCCAGEGRMAEICVVPGRYEPTLPEGPLVFSDPAVAYPATHALLQDARTAVPQVSLFSPVDRPRPWLDIAERSCWDNATARRWTRYYARWAARPDLLSSDDDDHHFVVEVDDRGRAHIRFGDDELGSRPDPGTRFLTSFRRGGGPAGNVGPDTITAVVAGDASGGTIVRVRNPLPAQGGTAAETVAHARLHAPYAFRSVLARAVTMADYEAIVLRDFGSQIQRAAAQVSGTTDSRTKVAIRLDPLGGKDDPELLLAVEQHLQRFRRIGHDLEVTGPKYVPIDLTLSVELVPHFRWGEVLRALLERFGNGDGGFFHPDQWTFGAGVPMSTIVAAALRIPGVARVAVVTLRRPGQVKDLPDHDFLVVGPDEVCRLDNDPELPDNGALTVKRSDQS